MPATAPTFTHLTPAGSTGCSGSPVTCASLWSALGTNAIVANGTLYVSTTGNFGATGRPSRTACRRTLVGVPDRLIRRDSVPSCATSGIESAQRGRSKIGLVVYFNHHCLALRSVAGGVIREALDGVAPIRQGDCVPPGQPSQFVSCFAAATHPGRPFNPMDHKIHLGNAVVA